MPRPRIVREEVRSVEEREPPPPSSLRAHDWLNVESRGVFNTRLNSKAPFDVYLSSDANAKIRRQAQRNAPARLEIMGFLLGEVSTWGGVQYSVIRDVVTTQLKSSSSKVRFDPDAFPRLFKEMDASGFDYILVGWYHSHPGHTCFLSKTDLKTQRSIFDQPYHSALVIDPVNEEIKMFKLRGDGYDETAFALFDVEPQFSAKGKAIRRRKLRVRPIPSV